MHAPKRLALPICSLFFFACSDGNATGVELEQPIAAVTAPVSLPAPAQSLESVTFKADGASAVPNPAEEDRRWERDEYSPLIQSRKDGKPTFTNRFAFLHGALWKEHLAHLKGRPDLRYLEVGLFEGKSLIWMFRNVLTDPSSTATGIDLFGPAGLEARYRENIDREGVTDRVTTLIGYSNEMLRPLEPKSFDLIYIDASHVAPDVLRDAVLCWDLLKTDGILIFDDYEYLPHLPDELRPGIAIDSFVTAFRNELEVLTRGRQMIVRRVEPVCFGECSAIGPYRYFWSWQKKQTGGTLYDPRTGARVPLTAKERTIVERLLSRPFGETEVIVPSSFLRDAATQAVLRKLDL